MSDDPFESAEFEAAWGAKKAQDLRALRESFFVQDETCVRVTEFNPQTGKYEIKMKLTKPLPIEARGIVADALRSFRNALDQAVFAATVVIKGKGNRRCHFPFGENPDDLEDSLSRRKAPQCRGIPEELFPVLRTCEPYPRGDGYTGGNDALKALGRVSGPHKHEVTLRVGGMSSSTGIMAPRIRIGPGGAHLHVDGWDHTKNEMVVFSFPPGGYVEAGIEVTMSVCFGPGPLKNVQAENFLFVLAEDVPFLISLIKAAAYEIGRT